jgi:hypothetical protein
LADYDTFTKLLDITATGKHAMSTRSQRIIFQVSFVLAGCIFIEIALRFMGYQPGDLKPNWLWFKPVDSLYVIHDFYTNEKGIQVADKSYWAGRLEINSEGFRGKEFSQLDSTHEKVMFIGDSFTWGLSANPLNSSFCDILQRKEPYNIINLGIPAADPAQYCRIAETYIPQLKPDLVFVVFYAGNDIMINDRKLEPYKGDFYWTNAGAIETEIDGCHFSSPQEAYKYLVNEKYYLRKPRHWYESLINKSALLSRLYSVKFRIKEKLDYERARKDSHITAKYLHRIKAVADENHVAVKFLFIPERKDAGESEEHYRSRYASLMADDSLKADWLVPTPEKKHYVPDPDGHLNNSGHSYYAAYIEKFLSGYFNGK